MFLEKVKSFISSQEFLKFVYAELLVLITMILISVNLLLFFPVLIMHAVLMFIAKSKKSYWVAGAVSAVATIGIGFVVSHPVKLAIVAVIGLMFLYLNKFKSKDKAIIDHLRSIFMLVMPFFVMFVVEFMQANADLMGLFLYHDVTGKYVVYHGVYFGTLVAIWVAYFIISRLVTNRFAALTVLTAPIFLVGTVNMFVLHFTNNPFILSDIFTFGTAMSVMSEQTFNAEIILRALASLIMMIVFYVSAFKLFRRSKIEISWKARIPQFIEGLVCAGLIIAFVFSWNFLNFRGNIAFGYIFYFPFEASQRVAEPEGFYEIDIDREIEEGVKNEAKVKPNVVVVMSEAFSDLPSVYGEKTSEDPMPYFHKLQKEYPSGTVYSSVIGNNTVSSEVECLTGLSTGLCDKGSNIFQKHLRKKDSFYSLGSYFQSLGYQSAVFHPSLADNYSRFDSYTTMGYDALVFEESLDKKDITKVRSFISDDTNYNTALELLKESSTPLFLMNITMQNHGAYDEDFDSKYDIDFGEYGNKYRDVERYLNLIRLSDDELKEFLAGVEKLDEPTVVLLFGDHQPMITWEFYADILGEEGVEFNTIDWQKRYKSYEIPYLLWSNYDMGDVEVPETTSINYLSVALKDALGTPTTDWFDKLEELREYYPVITENFVIDKEGKVIEMETLKNEIGSNDVSKDKAKSLLKEYWYSCYTTIKE